MRYFYLVIIFLTFIIGCDQPGHHPITPNLDSAISADGNQSDIYVLQDEGLPDQTTTELDLTLDMSVEVDLELDADPYAPILDPEFVMNKVEILASDTGFDLDDDGSANNGLALLFEDPLVGPVLGGDPNEFIARSVRRGELLLLLDFGQLNDFANDVRFNIDIFLGRDSDGRRRNNFNGEEDFFVTCSSLTDAGLPESRFEDVTLNDGELDGYFGQFRFLVSFSNTEVILRNARLTGRMNTDGESITNGRLGGAVTFVDLEEVVRNDPEIGPEFAQIMLGFLNSKLDIDLDNDGIKDALSASFSFEAVRGMINSDQPCME